MAGLAKTEDPVQASQVPFAARYLNCGQDAKQICGERRYNTTCWIPRDDAIEPKTKQKSNPSGQASWHPGNR